MAPQEFFRYTDSRGDTIIYKFDRDMVDNPDEPVITVYHEWRQAFANTYQLASVLLEGRAAADRYSMDKKPARGMELHRETFDKGKMRIFRWVPFHINPRGFEVLLD